MAFRWNLVLIKPIDQARFGHDITPSKQMCKLPEVCMFKDRDVLHVLTTKGPSQKVAMIQYVYMSPKRKLSNGFHSGDITCIWVSTVIVKFTGCISCSSSWKVTIYIVITLNSICHRALWRLSASRIQDLGLISISDFNHLILYLRRVEKNQILGTVCNMTIGLK